MTRDIDTIVVGSGLAGLTTAVYLSGQGQRVLVCEANSYLGGRTASWNEAGMQIESGLHRFLGFYTALPGLLKRAGVATDEIVCWEDEIEIRPKNGKPTVLGIAPFHKPLKTVWGLMGHNDFLSPRDKASLAKMFFEGMKLYKSNPLHLDSLTILEFAQGHHVTKRAIYHLLTPLTEGIFFLPIERYSAFNFFGLFMPHLKNLHKLRVGAFTGGMSTVMMEPLGQYIENHDGTIHTNELIERLIVESDHVKGVVSKYGIEYRAPHTILATSLQGAKDILGHDFGTHSSLQSLFLLPTMPSVTFQIELMAPSMPVDRTTFGPGTSLASFAEQSRTTFSTSKGRLSIILTPAEKFLDQSADQILAHVMQDTKTLGIDISAHVKDYRKVSLPYDFYSLEPGSEALRPHQKTDIPGLILAGDYTKQPYLATMEGAVVSGKKAASLALKH